MKQRRIYTQLRTKFNYEINSARCKILLNSNPIYLPRLFLWTIREKSRNRDFLLENAKNPGKREKKTATRFWLAKQTPVRGKRRVARGIVGSKRKRSHEGVINTLRHLHLTSSYVRTRTESLKRIRNSSGPSECVSPQLTYFSSPTTVHTCSFAIDHLSFPSGISILLLLLYIWEMLKIVESLKPFSSKINFPIVRAFRRINATSRWRVLGNKGSRIRWNVFVNGVSSSTILRNWSCSNREEYLSSNRAITAHIRGMKLRVDHRGKRSNVASRPSGCRRRHYFIIHSHGADKESQGRYMYRGGYKVTRCRELKPPRFSSGFLPVEKNNRRAERSWLASEHRAKGGARKEREEREKERK